LKVIDPIYHENRPEILIARLAADLGVPAPERGPGHGRSPVDGLMVLHAELCKILPRIRRDYRAETVYDKGVFEELKSAALETAGEIGFFE
jgi:hypothetical protein